MSSNRLTYDDCELKNRNKSNSDQLNWILDSGRFNNDNQCMVDLGVNGGNTNTMTNIADRVSVETQLMGLGNMDSKCKQAKPLENVNTGLPTCKNFYDGEIKPYNMEDDEPTLNKCDNNL